MTAIGRLVLCIEECLIEQQLPNNETIEINFYEGINYTALIEEEIYVIDREHKNIKLTTEIFNKHFKIV